MSNLIVEIKYEYTTQLTNLLAPLLYEGILSIYQESLKLSKKDDVLKCFQTLLKRVPKWNATIIENETNRILTSTHSHDWLNDLIKATFKSNLFVLMYNPLSSEQPKIDKHFYQYIKTQDFIHKAYIECARELWTAPHLLYHDYPAIEIKRNQRDCIIIIKDSIKETIRKLLPVKHILKFYLGDDVLQQDNEDVNFEKVLTDIDERNLNKLVKKDLSNDIPMNQAITTKPQLTYDSANNLQGGGSNLKKTTEEISINTKILNIIKKENNEESVYSNKFLKANNDITPVKHKNNHISESSSIILDNKIKNILETDTDLNTSLNYQEVYSNTHKDNKKSFFNNYLHL